MEIDPKISIKGDLLFFYGKKSAGIKEPRQLSFYLVIVILSISILWPLESIWNTRILFCSEQEEGTIEGEENLTKFITNYYKKVSLEKKIVITFL